MGSGIDKDTNYMEGMWSGEKLVPLIEGTTYKTLEGAIIAKQTLVDKMEEDYGFSRDMEKPHPNYAYNCGMLDAFIKAKEEEDNADQ